MRGKSYKAFLSNPKMGLRALYYYESQILVLCFWKMNVVKHVFVNILKEKINSENTIGVFSFEIELSIKDENTNTDFRYEVCPRQN